MDFDLGEIVSGLQQQLQNEALMGLDSSLVVAMTYEVILP